MKRPSNSDGDEANRFPHAADELSASSPARRIGETIIPFPAPPPLPGRKDAGASSASASSTFISLGAITHAVVLRLAGGYPKIRGPVKRLGGGGTTSPALSASLAEGDDAGG